MEERERERKNAGNRPQRPILKIHSGLSTRHAFIHTKIKCNPKTHRSLKKRIDLLQSKYVPVHAILYTYSGCGHNS